MKIMSNILIFLFYAILSGAGLITIKMAVSENPLTLANLLQNLFKPIFLLGFSLYAGGFLTSLFILSRFQLNVAYPLTASLFFIVVLSGSHLILKETMTVFHFVGVSLCLLGILFICYK